MVPLLQISPTLGSHVEVTLKLSIANDELLTSHQDALKISCNVQDSGIDTESWVVQIWTDLPAKPALRSGSGQWKALDVGDSRDIILDDTFFCRYVLDRRTRESENATFEEICEYHFTYRLRQRKNASHVEWLGGEGDNGVFRVRLQASFELHKASSPDSSPPTEAGFSHSALLFNSKGEEVQYDEQPDPKAVESLVPNASLSRDAKSASKVDQRHIRPVDIAHAPTEALADMTPNFGSLEQGSRHRNTIQEYPSIWSNLFEGTDPTISLEIVTGRTVATDSGSASTTSILASYSLNAGTSAAKVVGGLRPDIRRGARALALERSSTWWLCPRLSRDSDKPIQSDLAHSLLIMDVLEAGRIVVMLPLCNSATIATLQRDSSRSDMVNLVARNRSSASGTAQVILVIADRSLAGVIQMAVQEALEAGADALAVDSGSKKILATVSNGLEKFAGMFSKKGMTEENENIWAGLSFCTWNSLGLEMTSDSVLEAVKSIPADLQTVIIDDGWQDCVSHKRLVSLDARREFLAGRNDLSVLVQEIKQNKSSVRHVVFWCGIMGSTWKGLGPTLIQRYNAQPFSFQDEVVWLPHPKEMHTFWHDRFSLIHSAGGSGVKLDCQSSITYLRDLDTGTKEGLCGEHGIEADLSATSFALQQASRRAIETAAAAVWGKQWRSQGLVLYSGAMSGEWLNSSFALSPSPIRPETSGPLGLSYDEAPLILRTSDDYYPHGEDSHGWHIYCNAMNAFLTGAASNKSRVRADWDMFQSSHPFSALHASARAISGGPVVLTDERGRHDPSIIRKLVGKTKRGEEILCRSPSGALIADSSVWVEIGMHANGPGLGTKVISRVPDLKAAMVVIYNTRAGGRVEDLLLVEDIRNAVNGPTKTDVLVLSNSSHDIDIVAQESSTGKVMECSLEPRDFELFILASIHRGKNTQAVCLGILDKFAPLGAVKSAAFREMETAMPVLGNDGEATQTTQSLHRSQLDWTVSARSTPVEILQLIIATLLALVLRSSGDYLGENIRGGIRQISNLAGLDSSPIIATRGAQSSVRASLPASPDRPRAATSDRTQPLFAGDTFQVVVGLSGRVSIAFEHSNAHQDPEIRVDGDLVDKNFHEIKPLKGGIKQWYLLQIDLERWSEQPSRGTIAHCVDSWTIEVYWAS